ncbi:Hypp1074 [Branchiostoma lanceolatum]|uniref:Hypp1074 protein n=1 Tax=Branchiostoma lanceolatum TaxID=7740 RepID=A0A8K0EH80_BRALA|nr:Hypp1074 [Branchiostoma lanceolatum]
MLEPTLSTSCNRRTVDDSPDFQRVLNRMAFEVDSLAKKSAAVQAKVDKLNRDDLETNASKIHVTCEEMYELKERVSAVQTTLAEFNLTARDVCEDIRLIKTGAEQLQTKVQETDNTMGKVLSEINTLKLEQRSLSRSMDANSITKSAILAELKDIRDKNTHSSSTASLPATAEQNETILGGYGIHSFLGTGLQVLQHQPTKSTLCQRP